MSDDDKIFPILWELSDNLQVKSDGTVEFFGDAESLQRFKEMLAKLDPHGNRGVE
jgi:hypothetical protein